MTIYKPSKNDLDLNFKTIEDYNMTVRILKSDFYNGIINNRTYNLARHWLRVQLKHFYKERSILLAVYKERLKAYHDYKRSQKLLDLQDKKIKFNSLVGSLSDQDKAILKEFWHLV